MKMSPMMNLEKLFLKLFVGSVVAEASKVLVDIAFALSIKSCLDYDPFLFCCFCGNDHFQDFVLLEPVIAQIVDIAKLYHRQFESLYGYSSSYCQAASTCQWQDLYQVEEVCSMECIS